MAKRLFIGTMLPAPSQQAVADLRQSIEGDLAARWNCKLRWVRPDKLHITLLFLGICEPEQEAEIRKILTRLAPSLPQTQISYEEFEIFYSQKRPNAAVLLPAQVEEQLAEIGSKFRAELSQFCQKQDETHAFRPHLTLFRFPADNKTRYTVDGKLNLDKWLPLEQEIKQFSLIESHTGSQGADYIIVEEFALGGQQDNK